MCETTDTPRLESYLDKAGDVDEPVVIVAGFTATGQSWANAAKDWDDWKDINGVVDFHMSNLPRWKRDEVLKKLAWISKRHTLLPVAAGVRTSAFREAQLGRNKPLLGSAYRLCSLNCVIAISEWAMKRGRSPVEVFFDKDGKLYNEALSLYRDASKRPCLKKKFAIEKMEHTDRSNAPGIQLADALAHSLFAFNRERIEQPSLRMGSALAEVTQGILGNWLFTDRREVERWAETLNSAIESSSL